MPLPCANIFKLATASLVLTAGRCMLKKIAKQLIVIERPAEKDIPSLANSSHCISPASLGTCAATSISQVNRKMISSASKWTVFKPLWISCSLLWKILKQRSWGFSPSLALTPSCLLLKRKGALKLMTLLKFPLSFKIERSYLRTVYPPLHFHLWRKIQPSVSGAIAALRLPRTVRWRNTLR